MVPGITYSNCCNGLNLTPLDPMHHSDSKIDGIEWFQNAKIPRYAE